MNNFCRGSASEAFRAFSLAMALIASQGATFAQQASPSAAERQRPASDQGVKSDAEREVSPRAAAGEGGRAARNAARTEEDKDQSSSQPRLPAPSITRHKLELKGRTIEFTATVEAIPLRNGKNELTGELVMTSFTKDGDGSRRRPVLFAMNGGPGVASAWLDLGLVGPWRLPMSGESLYSSATPVAMPNDETFLDFTDLVFVDPIGTGYSRTIGKEDNGESSFYSVDGDVQSVAVAIRRWLVKHDRLVSPKFLIGESYSGIRVPKVAHELQVNQGVGVNGAVLVSPVLDFATITGPRHNVLQWVAALPSMAATVLDAKGPVSAAQLAEAEAYAANEYLTDLARGERDGQALDRIAPRVAALIGLDVKSVRRLAGRIDGQTFRRERDRDAGTIGSPYDATVGGLDPNPNSAFSYAFEDPFLVGFGAPLASTMIEVYSKLKWAPERKYELLSKSVSQAWKWGNRTSAPQSVDDLQKVMALDPGFKLLVAHGYADLVTPYFGSKLMLAQLPKLGDAERAKLIVYPGGHMFYSRDASRIAFRKEAEALISSVAP